MTTLASPITPNGIGYATGHSPTGAEELFDLLERPAWQKDALCREPKYAGVQFFPERGDDTRAAKRVCSGCLVRDECIAFALEMGERFGVWGGTSERERRRLRRSAA